ncbi:MAG: 23S rRNA pseudouridine(2605) synthase RluB [Ectothiorhodospiraceae bacterium]|nr:23S rRNA pseudouridine(2605) synthase RluB [Ectothiorhodospiraceae bacterium]
MSDEKLQKVLARAGLGSRRQLEELISQGRVLVNGEPARLGDRVTGHEKIKLDGRLIPTNRLAGPDRRVLIYHKPVGEVSTRSDPEGRPTVFASLPRIGSGRWVSVGRLDVNTLGLLLFTNDGELANRLMHPRHQLLREYAVRIFGQVDQAKLQRLVSGVRLEDGEARFETVQPGGGDGGNQWYRGTLREGRQREVRRLWESQGVQVSRLIRVAYGPVQLPKDLARGEWRFLDREAVAELCRCVEMDPEQPVGKPELRHRPARKPTARQKKRRR